MTFIDNYRKQQEAGQAGWWQALQQAPSALWKFLSNGTMLPDPSTDYPSAVNAAIEADKYINPLRWPSTITHGGLAAEGPVAAGQDLRRQMMSQGWNDLQAWFGDNFLTSEKEVAARQAAAEQAKTGSSAPIAVSPDARVSQAKAVADRKSPIDIFSLPVPGMPKPPTVTPFRMPNLPGMQPMPAPPPLTATQLPMMPKPGALPLPPGVVAPDYGPFDELMKKAAPVAPTPDGKWGDAGAMLAQAAANWDPRSGWGGLLAAGFGGAAAGVRATKKSNKEQQKEYEAAMRQWQMTQAEIAAKRAEGAASRSNQDLQNRYNYDVNAAETEQNWMQKNAEIAARNRESQNSVDNQNKQNQYEWQTGTVKQNNLSAIEQHKIDVENLQAIHQANQENAKILYQDEVARAERDAPQVMDSNKDGVLWSEIKDGKRVVRYQPFGKDITGEKDLKKIKDELGPDAYDLALFNRYSENKDTLGIMKHVAQSAVDGGYAAEAFGEDVYNEAVDAISADPSLGTPGSKEYAAKFSEALSNRLLRYVKLTDQAQLDKLVMNGNNFARYFVGASNGGN